VVNVLRGDLKSVEKEAGAPGIKLRGAKGVEYMGEGKLDGAAIFENGELDRFFRGTVLLRRKAVQARVEVAIMRTAESG
jgi:hypothetical protein